MLILVFCTSSAYSLQREAIKQCCIRLSRQLRGPSKLDTDTNSNNNLRAGFSKNLMTILEIFVRCMPILRQIYDNANFRKIL